MKDALRLIFKFKFSYLIYLAFILFGFYLILQYPNPGEENSAQPAVTHQETPALAQSKQAGQPDTAPSQNSTAHEALNYADPIVVGKTVVCLDVEEGKPLLAKSKFNRNIDYIYCWTELSYIEDSDYILHRWIYQGGTEEREYATKKLSISPEKQAVWSKVQMHPNLAGSWRVDILSSEKKLLDSVEFYLY